MALSGNRVAATSIWIGTTASNGSSDTYTEIKGAMVVGGNVGTAWQSADTTWISDTMRQSTKTVRDGGNIDLELNELIGDAGQTALKAAYNDTSDLDYNFEVRYPQGDKHRLKVKVMTWEPTVGNATAVRKVRSRLDQQAEATYVAAS